MTFATGPSARPTPCSIRNARSHSRSTHGEVVADEHDRPPLLDRELADLAHALALERGVADREHLVDEHDLRVQVRRDREAEAHEHAARVALDRRVDERLDARELDDRVEPAGDLLAAEPEDRAVEDRRSRGPVSSGWKPVPTSSSVATRPRSSMRPSVGSVIRASSLSSVLLPAPFGPIRPTTSPGATSSDDVAQRPERLRRRRAVARGRRESAAQRVPICSDSSAPPVPASPAAVALAQVLDADRRARSSLRSRRRSCARRGRSTGSRSASSDGRLDERHDQRQPAGKSDPGSTIQRISSITPTIGLSAVQQLVRLRDVAERIDDRRDEQADEHA